MSEMWVDPYDDLGPSSGEAYDNYRKRQEKQRGLLPEEPTREVCVYSYPTFYRATGAIGRFLKRNFYDRPRSLWLRFECWVHSFF